MQCHANTHALPQRPGLVTDRVLQLDGGGGRRGRSLEDRKRRVALAARLDQPSPARRDDLLDQLVVARECHRHGGGVGLPGRGRSLDVGEQKGHGPRHRRKILCRWGIQRDVLRNNRRLEPAKLRAGVDPQLVGQQRPGTLISVERLALPAGPVEGEHQLAPTPFPQWGLGHRRLEIADDFRGATGREQRVRPVFDERGVTFDPAGLLGQPPPAIGQFGDSAPQGHRFLEAGDRLAGIAGGRGLSPGLGRRFVAGGINRGPVQSPARPLGHHDTVAKGAAQRRDMGL